MTFHIKKGWFFLCLQIHVKSYQLGIIPNKQYFYFGLGVTIYVHNFNRIKFWSLSDAFYLFILLKTYKA